MDVLAISGSLRAGASNTALLEAAGQLAPAGVCVQLYEGLASLPHFNPDLEAPEARALPAAVAGLRARVGRANALLLSTPEYAHGLPGAFKNALDWLVGSTEFPGKPVAFISPNARSTHAQAQLREVLTTMSARLVEGACAVVPLPRRDMTVADIVADGELSAALTVALAALARAAREDGSRDRRGG